MDLSIFFLVFGLCFIVFNKKMAYWAVEFQYRLLNVRYSELGFRVGFYIGGSLFFLIGLLGLFHVIKN
jgi:hypothetical protein